jgi:glycosyltransferase involved in cell wall biosynthesis
MENNTLYFVQFSKDTNDGGTSRNHAFCEYYKKQGAKVYNLYQTNKFLRISKLLFVLRLLITSKDKTIFIHQGTMIFLFPMSVVKYQFVTKILFNTLQKIANRNKLIIEINDLPYEQAIDLELPIDGFIDRFQDKLYSLKNCYYIFASREMERYVKTKFNIDDTHTEVIVNGADKIVKAKNALNEFKLPNGKYNCVYAGTLNKGRQVEELITMFSGLDHVNLILLGDWGEWLLDYDLPENVVYLGNKSNAVAHQIVSSCDLGLIQYDSSRFYYNLCYPTKISFYLTAGIPVLSTPLTELMYHFGDSKGVFFKAIDQWAVFLESVDQSLLEKAKAAALTESTSYEWQSLLSSSELLNPGN